MDTEPGTIPPGPSPTSPASSALPHGAERSTPVPPTLAWPSSVPTPMPPAPTRSVPAPPAPVAQGEGFGQPLPEALPPGIPPIKSAEELGYGDEFAETAADLILDRVVRLFRFLLEMTQQGQEPVRTFDKHPWCQSLAAVPQHPLVRCGTTEAVHDEGVVLEVRRPPTNLRPPLTEPLRLWLATSLDDPAKEPEVLAEIMVGGAIRTFDEDIDRPARWRAYLHEWSLWAEQERRDGPVRRLYDHLRQLHDLLEGQGERYQLLLADGLLSWSAPNGRIRHPLIGRRVDISFDLAQQQVRVVDAAQSTVPLFSCLRGQTDVDGRAIAAAYAEVRGNDPHPLDPHATALLVSIRNRWFGGDGRPGQPKVTSYPLLLLVTSAGTIEPMLQGIIDDLGKVLAGGVKAVDLPAGLRAVVGEIGHAAVQTDIGVADTDPDDPKQEILFTKPANVEQARIVAHLRRHPGVVVLGPPGTGKTHTIANLIGHFLAEGKTILVTSETAKALGEVRNKVVAELQPLCVPLLGSDRESRDELSKCVHGILEQLARSTKSELARRAVQLGADRMNVGQELQALRDRVLAVCLSEVGPIVLSGESVEPIEAARWVASHASGNAWIPSPLAAGVSCPLTANEVRELYLLNAEMTPSEESELLGSLPDPADLPTAATLAAAVARRAELSRSAERSADGWMREAKASDAGGLHALLEGIRPALLTGPEAWKLSVAEDGRPGNPRRALWEDLLSSHEAALARLVEEQRSTARHVVDLGIADIGEEIEAVRGLRAHVAGGGGLSAWALLFRGPWKERLARWRIDGVAASTADHFRCIDAVLGLRLARTRFLRLWATLVSQQGGPSTVALGPEPERGAQQVLTYVRQLLSWRTGAWHEIVQRMNVVGLDWTCLLAARPLLVGTNSELRREVDALRDAVVPRVERRLALLDLADVEKQLAGLREPLSRAATGHPGSILIASALDAWDAADGPRYGEALDALQCVRARGAAFARRAALLDTLATGARQWAVELAARKAPHDRSEPPADTATAWRWRQLVEELDRRNQEDLPRLLAAIERRATRLLDVTAKLVQARAWASQHDRAAGAARIALQGWLDTMHAIGAGYGRRVPELLAKANQLLVQARGAVPVWIMPLDRVYQVIAPSVRPRFDVVIVDEASQVGPDGLALFYLGEKIVVVGDDQQVTPSDIGRTVADMAHLRAQWLSGIPNAHLYDGKRSLYGLAQSTFAAQVGLREHFRCVPDIIRFSNALCYLPRGQGILPLREAASASVFPPLIAHRVLGRRNHPGKVNATEARRVAALFGAMVDHPAYEGVTFGIISLLGSEQSLEIERIIRKYLDLAEPRLEFVKGGGGMTRRLCGEPPNFQGDERTVIVLSLVDSGDGEGPLTRLAEGTFQSRYNVAASRAQDQLWVVHSLDPAGDLQPDDLRRKLIDHATDPRRLLDLALEAGERAESPFETAVIDILTAKGYKVRSQYPVGAYRIDLVVSDGRSRLAVECDGERAHPPEKLKEDMRRQAILERRGWRFVRIRGSAFYRDREAAMAPVLARLEELSIRPVLLHPIPRGAEGGPGRAHSGEELIEDVVRRAEQLELNWASRDLEEHASAELAAQPTAGRRWQARR